jgi:alanine racemase
VNRGAVAEISLSAIAYNLKFVKKIVKNLPVIAVVKADAYGHGAVEVSKRLIKEGISYLAVAYTSEAIELRDAGIPAPIIVLFDRGDIKEFLDYKLIPVIYDVDTALFFSNEARKRGVTIKVHVKVDTGMGRLGLSGNNVVNDLIKISEMKGIELAGLLSHFSEADLSDMSYAVLQLDRFNKIRKAISKKLKRTIFSHMANSAAVLTFTDAYLDAVRPGLMLYGYSPIDYNQNPPYPSLEKRGKGDFESGGQGWEGDPVALTLVPAMKIKTRILCIRSMPPGSPISYGRTFISKRPSRIGVLPLGYADGYSRLFSNNAEVIVRGKRVPVVGRICMDLTMTDLTDVRGVRENDEVIIMGKQGKESITAQELAYRANTISYEILTSLGGKSKRVYFEDH